MYDIPIKKCIFSILDTGVYMYYYVLRSFSMSLVTFLNSNRFEEFRNPNVQMDIWVVRHSFLF